MVRFSRPWKERREAMAATAQGTEYRIGGTLFVSMELSSRVWKVTSTSEVGGKVREKNVPAGDLAGVMEEFCKAKKKQGLREDAEVVSCYEAGRDGFWIHRELTLLGVTNLVVDPSSIEVDRRARRRKTDRIDGRKLLAHLLRWCGGERCWSVVAVPSIEEEDARQLHRELEALKRERTRHRNRISSLLVVHGIRAEITDDFAERLSEMQLRDGRALPEHLCERLVRESERLHVVRAQIAELEAERRALIRTSSDPAIEMVRKLMGLSGIGENAAWLWVMEFFAWRHFRNRREIGSLAGLTPTPHASGESRRELGIDKAGNPRVRAMAIEIAWCWVRYQPDSELTRWWVRFANNGRSRRIGIVAVARKLLVAMWRYLEFDCVPQGARLKAA